MQLVDGVATSNRITSLAAGNHDIAAVYSGATTFDASTSPEIIQAINRAPLTIMANTQTRYFGQLNPVLTASYVGFVNGDGPASLTSQVILSTSAVAGSDPGSYLITASDASSPNYVITFQESTLTVLPPPGRVDRGRLAFVTSLYRDILGRAAGPEGLQYWMKELKKGLKAHFVPRLFWNSTEHHTLIRQNRAPHVTLQKASSDALKAWTQAVRTKPSLPKGPLGLLPGTRRAFHRA